MIILLPSIYYFRNNAFHKRKNADQVEIKIMLFNKYLGEFKDQELEAEYVRQETAISMRFIQYAVLSFSFLFFLFIIPDYHLNQDNLALWNILAIRCTFLVLAFLLYLRLKSRFVHHHILNSISIYQLLVSVSFLLIFYLYDVPNIYIQSLGVVLLILAFFHFPSRWIYTLLVSVFLGTGFVVTAFLRPEQFVFMDLLAISIYIALVITMSSVSSYRLNVYKRLQYHNNKELIRLSYTDTLTGIYDRRKLDHEIQKWIELATRYKHDFSIILFDIDDLKKINDLYGHLMGDQVLRTVTRLVQECLRKTDIFARWGGDEFAVLLPHTNKDQAKELALRIRDTIANYTFNQVGRVSCSFGLSAFVVGESSDQFLSRADNKMYEAKNSGKDMVK